MHSVPSENSGDLFQLYQEQLAQKDSQIAELTALLRESNARLAQQQRISENVLATLAPSTNRSSTPAPAADGSIPAVPGTIPVEDADGRMSAPLLEPGVTDGEPWVRKIGEPGMRGNAEPAGAPAADSAHDSGEPTDTLTARSTEGESAEPEGAFVTEDLADEEDHGLSEQPHGTALQRFDATMADTEQAGAPIPMSYFGPPMAGLAQNLKEATAAQEPVALSEIPETEEAIHGLHADPRKPTAPSGGTPWRLPLILTVTVAAAAVVVGLTWQTLFGVGSPQTRSLRTLRGLKPIIDKERPNVLQPPGGSSSSVTPAQAAGSTTLPPIASRPQGDTAAPAAQSAPGREKGAPKPARDAAQDGRLVQAVASANLARVRSLIAAGADVDARNEHGSSVLAIAARQGYAVITERLLARGANVNAANDRGWTPLMLAVNYKHPRIVNTLLRHGARTDLVNSQGTTALMLAAQQGNHEIVNRLLANGAPVMVKNNEGLTAQDLAVRYGHPVVAAALAQITKAQPQP